MNGVVGLKPSTGVTSRRGSCISNVYQDTVGVIAQTTRDAAHVLSVIAGEMSRSVGERVLTSGQVRTSATPSLLATRRMICIK